MNLLTEASNGLGAVLLPVAAALLFEELTCGGLARLLIVPWPRRRKHTYTDDPVGSQDMPTTYPTTKPNQHSGERK
jgi:hypothetical protein